MTGTEKAPDAGANVVYRQIGRSLVRTDAPGKAVGKTPYAGDYTMPGMLHAKVVRSPLASARLERIDVEAARALPGVVCVLTAADLPDRLAPTDIPGQTGQARLKTDQQILVRERVRYHGELVRLEFSPDEMEEALNVEMAARLTAIFKPLGFHYVTIDLEGYRQGSLNEVLPTGSSLPRPGEPK